jgi:hypothetical protein
MSEFDKVFRDKLYDREVPFNEDAWLRAKSMIDASQASGFWSSGRIAAAIVLLITTVSLGSYLTFGLNGSGQYELKSYANNSGASNIYEGIIFPSNVTSSGINETNNSSEKQRTEISSNETTSDRSQRSQIKASTKKSNTSNVQAGSHLITGLNDAERNEVQSRNPGVESNRFLSSTLMTKRTASSLSQMEDQQLMSNPVVSFENKDEKTEKEIFRNHALSFEVSAGMANEFKNPLNTSDNLGASAGLGLKYQYNINENWSVGTGLLYELRNGAPIAYSVKDIEYGFEEIVTITDYRTQRIHRLTVPLEVGFNWRGKHNFRGGIRTSYLATTKTEVVTYNTSVESTTEENATHEWGYLNGHQPLTFSGKFAYEYMLNPQWGLGCKAILGISDVTDDTHFQNALVDRDHQIQLTLRYRFFEF